jgi:hypothetical protein
MAVTSSTRLGITRWSAGTDPYTRAQRDGNNATLDDLVAIDRQGLAAGRPATGTRGTYHYATDTGVLTRDTGTAWVTIATLGTDERLKLGAAARAGTNLPATPARLTVTADGSGTMPIAAQVGAGSAATDDAIALVSSTGAELLVIDADGALRAGNIAGAGAITRSGYVTVNNPDPAARTLTINVNGPGGLTADLIRAATQGTRRFTVDALGRVYLSALSDNAAPDTPTGAGVLYCDNVGRLRYKGPGGTVTILAER